ncbi:MAG TPA: tRNA 2-thiouridine(34) synthase MnmA [Acidimicrobiales bacterium]|nr:tRNA 2-thiouridine(34) synthase MnmA [Acidimicrobiales bacterium]
MRVLVAMSGGVDSSVAAALLQEQGHEVVGVTMKLWGGESDSGCCSVSDVDDARRVADQLGIDHHVFNFGDDFTRDVIEPYVADHAAGRTPNPCIECNRHLKFDRLLRRADALGFDVVATGHHVRLATDAAGRRHLARAADPAKDQSYVLYVVAGAVLDRVAFPVGDMTKDEVRGHAARLGLRTASKPDSQDVCFITSVEGRRGFLADRIRYTPGRVVDGEGAEVGRVDAVELVTIGQRRGLDLGGNPTPRYAVDVDVAAATVTIGDATALRADEVRLADVVWAHDPVSGPVLAQCSAHGTPHRAHVEPTPTGATVTFAEPQRRLAPGQSVVLYRDDLVVGGGIATRSSGG